MARRIKTRKRTTPATAPAARVALYPSRNWARPSVRIFWAIGVLVLLTLAAYSNSFTGVFVFDDLGNIVDSPAVRHLWPQFECQMPCDPRITFWGQPGRPLLGLSFAINYAVGGFAVLGYHVVNLAIHLANALLLFGILRRTFALPVLREKFGDHALALAFAIALLWAVHPLQTESVTYIVQRAESLVSLFYLLTLYCVVRGVESGKSTRWYAGAVFACLLGMSTKEVMVTAPVVLLLYDWIFLAGSMQEALRRRRWLYAGLALTWVWLGYLVISSRSLSGLYPSINDGTRGNSDQWTYAITQVEVLLYYLRLSVWPNPLVLDYAWPAAKSFWEIFPAALAIGVLLMTTLWGLLTRRMWAFLGANFFLILSPTSSIVPLFDDYIFEHRMYLALAAVLTGLVLAGYVGSRAWASRGGVPRQTSLAAGMAIAVALATTLGALTYQRNKDYASELSIWQDTVAKAPNNPRVHGNLGLALARIGRTDEAIRQYRETLRLKPDYVQAHNNLGNVLVEINQNAEAIVHYREALRLRPDLAEAHYGWANALAGTGETAGAMDHYQAALKLKPDYAEAHFNVGRVLARIGQVDEAIGHYQEALKFNPAFAEAHNNLGNLLARKGRTAEAIVQYQDALRSKPDLAEAHFSLANVLAESGKPSEAIVHYQEAVRLKLDYAAAHSNLGVVFFKKGDIEKAIEQFRQALKIDPKYADAQKNLDKLTALRK